VLAWDEANRSGYALLTVAATPQLIGFGVATGTTDEARRREILRVFYEVEQDHVGDGVRMAAVYMEDHHLQLEGGRATGKSIRAVWKLRTVLGWLEMACTLYRWRPVAVAADVWRRAVYGRQWIKGADRERYKELAPMLVRSLFPHLGRALLSHDEAEAILIGVYGAREEWRARQQKRR
jgi:hypothetical protein